ncbi:MAG: hypothetical protein JO187_02145 [Acidobacteria bacterium]|nr:hypothetical protein [Acidobacteriota bacterium]
MRPFIAALILSSGLLFAQQSPDAPQSNPSPGPAQGHRGPHDFRPGVIGTITSINGNSVVVKTFDGATATVNITPQTMFRKDQQPAKLTDFKVGDMVFVRGEAVGENTWTATSMGSRSDSTRRFREGMGKQFVAGEIKSIDGLKLTIARVDGETQTITVDENTSFRKHGESVTLADFAPGDHIFARGELKNGVFVPSVLNAGEPGRMGPGGPTQGPAGAPTAAPAGDAPPKEGSNPRQ